MIGNTILNYSDIFESVTKQIEAIEEFLKHYSFLMSSCFAATWDLAPCPHSQCLFHYVLLMPTKFSCLAAAQDLAPSLHFHYLPNDLLHHQAGDRKGKVSNFRWLRDRKIGSGILSSSVVWSKSTESCNSWNALPPSLLFHYSDTQIWLLFLLVKYNTTFKLKC